MKMRKVLAAVQIGTFGGRSVLSGILEHLNAAHPWDLRILQSEKDISADVVREAEAEGYDGFIFSFIGDEASAAEIHACTKPVVLIGSRKDGFDDRLGKTAFVWTDNRAIGTRGGKYLTGLGRFNSYGFIHSYADAPYSRMRAEGYVSWIDSSTGKNVRTFTPGFEPGSSADLRELADWLRDLPRPAALMAACDWRALHVISAAERQGLEIPRQLSLLGVDNDELLAAHSHPALSSIQPGLFNMGLRASIELDRLMSAHKIPKLRTTLIPPQGIIERESTGFATPSVSLAERARQFIASHAKEGISTADVVAHLGCSRNLADLRYREIEGLSIHAAIEKARLDEVRKLLETTERPMGVIARQCGFSSSSTLAHLFKKRFGFTANAWREKGKGERSSAGERVQADKGRRAH